MAQYRAGDWQLLVTGRTMLLVAPDTPAPLVQALWERLQSDPDLAELVDALTGGAGVSLAAIPPFAAAIVEGEGIRAAVRGSLHVDAETDGDAEHISGENVTTWSERYVAGARRVTLTVSGADAGGTPLPILGGIVGASSAVLEAAPEPAEVLGSGPFDGLRGRSEIPESATSVPEPVVSVPEPVKGPAPLTGETLIPTETVTPEESEPADDVDVFDQLFGDTVHSPKGATPPPAAPGDHDGATISIEEARRLRTDPPAAASEAPTAVLPVTSTSRIRLSTGQEVALDRTVVIGRRPRSTRASGTDLPHLVAVESPQQDISRNHLEIRPEGDTVVVVDLHTTNGSTLLRPGADPVRLHPGEQTLVLGGDVIDLGDGVTVAFEGLP